MLASMPLQVTGVNHDDCSQTCSCALHKLLQDASKASKLANTSTDRTSFVCALMQDWGGGETADTKSIAI